MPSFLPPAAASSEVLRTLNEQNEAQKTLEVTSFRTTGVQQLVIWHLQGPEAVGTLNPH